MALPITVPYTFGNATTAIPLSNLDSDYATVYQAVNGIGNGSVALANVAITGGTISGNTTASNVTVSSGTFTNVTLSNVTISSVSTPITAAEGGTGSSSAFTANGVAYATSTSALATGSSLVWTGSSLGVGTSSPSGTLHVEGPYASNYVRIASGSDNNLLLGSGNAIITGAGSTDVGIRSSAAMLFATGGGTERMRLTSAGMLLLGTTVSDTVAGMTIAGSVSGTDITTAYNNSLFAIKNTDRTTNNLTVMYFDGLNSGGSVRGLGAIGMQVTSWTDGAINSNMLFWTSNSGSVAERMRIDSSGNLLVGTTNSAGSTSNTAKVVGGQFKSVAGTASSSSTPTTMFTMSTVGTYYVSVLYAASNAAAFDAFAIIVYDGSSQRIVLQSNGTQVLITLSGTNVQVTNLFNSSTVNWSYMLQSIN